MKKIVALTLGVVLFSATVHAQENDWNETAVNKFCSDQWGDDFSMQAYCVQQHKTGHTNFVALLQTHREEQLHSAFSKCAEEWSIQWDMVAYCADKQIEGYTSLPSKVTGLPKDIADKVLNLCVQEWPDDYSMTAYCTEQQSTAWKKLNN